jgi:histidinol-phosphate aminotransferase
MKNFNIQNLIRSNVAALSPYSSARDEFTDFEKDMIFLDANENPFETNVNRYPDPQQRDVKALLAAQKGLSQDSILLGNGSDEVLDLLFRAFCEPHKDNVITLPPTYGMYKVLAEINAVENREVLLTNDFEPNVFEILKNITSNISSSKDEKSFVSSMALTGCTKLLFLCSPNNPTGNCFSEQSITKLLTSFNGLVIIDEAYIDFSEISSWLSRVAEFPNLVITQTLSKAYGMAGIRLGACYASKEIIRILNTIKPPYNVNELTQQKAFERLVNINDVSDELTLILKEKERLYKALLKVRFIQKVFPSQANFILVKVDDAKQRYQELLDAGIVVRDRSSLPLCENSLRITIGKEDENNKLIEVLKSL